MTRSHRAAYLPIHSIAARVLPVQYQGYIIAWAHSRTYYFRKRMHMSKRDCSAAAAVSSATLVGGASFYDVSRNTPNTSADNRAGAAML
jgi:hypothetical protein